MTGSHFWVNFIAEVTSPLARQLDNRPLQQQLLLLHLFTFLRWAGKVDTTLFVSNQPTHPETPFPNRCPCRPPSGRILSPDAPSHRPRNWQSHLEKRVCSATEVHRYGDVVEDPLVALRLNGYRRG